MEPNVKIISDPNWINGTQLKLQAIKAVKEQLGLSLKEARDVIEGKEFHIHESEFKKLKTALKACGYILDTVVNDSVAPVKIIDGNPSNIVNKTIVHLTKDGQIGVVSINQIEEEMYSFLYNNVDMISTMLKKHFPSINMFVGDRMDSNNNPTQCCCIALNVEGKYNTVENINRLANFASLIQDRVQSIVQIILRIGNLYKDFEGTFPKQ